MRKTLAILLLLACSLYSGDWENIGLGGGGAQYSPANSPHDKNIFFVSCDMGGFYRSVDSAKTWKMFDTRKISGTNRSEVAFHPSDPNIIFTGSSQGLQVSKDKGLNWELLKNQPWGKKYINVIYISKKNPASMFASAEKEAWTSPDGGISWSRIEALSDVKGFFAEDGLWLAGTLQGVFLSKDSGNAWKLVKDGAIASFCGGSGNGRTFLYCLSGGKLSVSSNKGETWKDSMKGIRSTSALYKVVCGESQPETAYVDSNKEYKVYKTNDGGEQWENCYNPGVGSGNTEIGWLSYQWGLGWGGPFNTGFNINRADPQTIMGTNYGETIISTDGGKSWRQVYSTPVNKPSRSSIWKSRGLEVTTTWNYYVDPFEKNRHYICYTDFGFARSEDFGSTWALGVEGNPWQNSVYELAFDKENKGVIYAAASNQHDIPTWTNVDKVKHPGGIIKSENFGKNWISISKGLPAVPATSIIKDGKTLYAAMFGDGVYRSDDLGLSWVKKSSGLGQEGNKHVHKLKLGASGALYCSITAKRDGSKFPVPGGLYKSVDKGESWTCLLEHPWLMNFSIHPNDEKILYAAGSAIPGNHDAGGILKSADGGQTWKRLDIGFSAKYSTYTHATGISFDPSSSRKVYAASLTHGIMFSEDDGNSWKEFDGPPFLGVTGVVWDEDTMYVTTFGGGVWRRRN